MKPYRKRAMESWNAGKRGKSNSDSSERQFSKREIQRQLAEDEEKYLERYHKGKRTRNERARLEYRVKWYQEVVGRWKRLGTSSSMDSYFRHALQDAKRKLREKFPDSEFARDE